MYKLQSWFQFLKKRIKKQFKFKTNKIKINNIIINEIIKQKDTTQKIKKINNYKSNKNIEKHRKWIRFSVNKKGMNEKLM